MAVDETEVARVRRGLVTLVVVAMGCVPPAAPGATQSVLPPQEIQTDLSESSQGPFASSTSHPSTGPSPAQSVASPSAPASTTRPGPTVDAGQGQLQWTRLNEFASNGPSPIAGARLGDVYVAGGLHIETETFGWSGALWTSRDGRSWASLDPGIDLSGTPVRALASRGTDLIAAGPFGFCFMHCDGGLLADSGSTIFLGSSSDDWRRLDRPAGLAHGLLTDVLITEQLIVGVGVVNNPNRPADPPPYPDGTETMPMAWFSVDGTAWERANGVSTGLAMHSLTASGNGLVAGVERDHIDAELVWSRTGEEWIATGERLDLDDLVAYPGGFVAYSWLGGESLALTSVDGRAWNRQAIDPPMSALPGSVAWIGTTFLAIAEPESQFDNMGWQNRAWTSPDGLTWREADLPADMPEDASYQLIPFDGFALVSVYGPAGEGIWHVELGL